LVNLFLVSAQWEQLKTQNLVTQGYRFAKSTRTNVRSQIRQWVYFCTYFGVPVLPATEVDLCLFLELMSNSSGFGHIKNVLGGIRYLHHSLSCDFPTESVRLEDTLQGLKRKLKGTPKQVLPIDPVILRRMYKYVNTRNTRDLALWCGFLVAFYTLFRKANVCPKEQKYDPETVLTRGDVVIDHENERVLIFVNFSKTNQFQKQCHVIPIPKNVDPSLDLFTHLAALFRQVNADNDAPALSYSSKCFVTHQTFTEKLKTLLAKSGLDPSLFSGHSFRRGGASYLYSVGGSTLMVQVMGSWSSQIFTRYLYLSLEDRLAAQNLIMDNINKTVGQTELPPSIFLPDN
jgi:hypothetical protein